MSQRARTVGRRTLLLDLLAEVRPELTPNEVRALVEAGQVFVDGKRTRQVDQRLSAGTKVVVHDAPPSPAQSIPILYEDPQILVIDKPAGIHLNETQTTARLAAVEALGDRDLYLVHRIDVGTTGVVLLAKNRAMAEQLSAAFRERRVAKRYLAIAVGVVESARVDAPIGPDRKRPRARAILKDGKPSITELRCVSTKDGLSAVEARPITGRTHQIRLHLAHLGAPLLGDTLYGGPSAARLAGTILRPARPLLHARSLELEIGGQNRTFLAPIPSDLAEIQALGLPLEPPEPS